MRPCVHVWQAPPHDPPPAKTSLEVHTRTCTNMLVLSSYRQLQQRRTFHAHFIRPRVSDLHGMDACVCLQVTVVVVSSPSAGPLNFTIGQPSGEGIVSYVGQQSRYHAEAAAWRVYNRLARTHANTSSSIHALSHTCFPFSPFFVFEHFQNAVISALRTRKQNIKVKCQHTHKRVACQCQMSQHRSRGAHTKVCQHLRGSQRI